MKSSNNHKISIITVCYNEVDEIEKTCASVVAQIYDNIEWIVVDGGSNDGTIKIFKKYEKYIHKFISEKDDGVYDAMNKGIKMATGEFLLFLNGGDYLFSNGILSNIFRNTRYKSDILYGDCCIVHKDGKKQLSNFPKNINKYYFLNVCINHQSTFIRRDLFEKHGLYDTDYKILADYEKWLFFCQKQVVFEKIPKIVSNFKFFDGLSSQKKSNRLKLEERTRIENKYFNFLEIIFIKIIKKYCLELILKIKFALFSPRKYIRKFFENILNSRLRGPARRIYYLFKVKK